MTARRLIALLPAGLLGAGAAVLVSCGSSGAGLIPSENAGPLVADFQAVERAALKGSGNCAPTEAALRTTERDFAALPASVDAALHAKLRQGISHLHEQALELCTQLLTTTTGSNSTTPTTTPPSTQTKTEPTSTTPPSSTTGTSTAPSSTTTTSGTEGGTAPEASGEGPGEGNGEEAEARGGGHEDSGVGNSGVSGNGGTGSGGRGSER